MRKKHSVPRSDVDIEDMLAEMDGKQTHKKAPSFT